MSKLNESYHPPKSDADFVEWDGQTRFPHEFGTLVEVEFRNETRTVGASYEFTWDQTGRQTEILRYRVVPEADREQREMDVRVYNRKISTY